MDRCENDPEPFYLDDVGPNEEELNDDTEEIEEPEEDETIDEYLDRTDLDRLEWERIQDDLYPGEYAEPETREPLVHRDTDEIQRWLRRERSDG